MNSLNPKFIFVTGGVVSSLGKGIIASSLGLLFKERGFKVTIQKLDPYLNVDPGTMSPYQHGEVFVTEDGAETDLDLGHYERFIDSNLYKINNVTAGQIYSEVIEKERQGEYLGGTVQMIPHVSNQIKLKILEAAHKTESEITIVEVGGTVGDIESLIFLEAIRQIGHETAGNDVAYVHVTLIPMLKSTQELKTKPTQHSVELLRSKGIYPSVLICRSEKPLDPHLQEKLSLFTGVSQNSVIECLDQQSIYQVPVHLEEQGLATTLLEKLGLKDNSYNLESWKGIVDKIVNKNAPSITIAIVGKYTELGDSYISIVEALKHASAHQNLSVEIKWVNSERLEDQSYNFAEILKDVHGVIIPGGFGERGVEGKVKTIQYIREHRIPFLGLCLGMQCAVIEFARNVAGMENAHSTEFSSETKYPVIDFLPGQHEGIEKGGTMRLGNCPCKLAPNTLAAEAYQSEEVGERHRHRYEFNNLYRDELEKAGLIISGTSPDNNLVEIVELSKNQHPFFIATQFHPEYKSRPERVHPLFLSLIKNANVLASGGQVNIDSLAAS